MVHSGLTASPQPVAMTLHLWSNRYCNRDNVLTAILMVVTFDKHRLLLIQFDYRNAVVKR